MDFFANYMFLENFLVQVLIAIALGILIGIFTGLTPGIHVNMVSLVALTISPALLGYTNALVISIFIISMCITHTFLDFVPSVFLGAPNDNTAMSVLPGHKLLLSGNGYDAIRLSTIGGLSSLFICIILIPILIPLFKYVYPLIKQYIGYFLILIVIVMILREKNKLGSSIVFLISGILGILVFAIPNLNDPLFPLLSGLFGISTLIISFSENTKIPKQNLKATIKVNKKRLVKTSLLATFAGTLTAFFPGMGTSQGAVIANELDKKASGHDFIILVGGIGLVNFVLSLITFVSIDKARNGAIVVVQELLTSITIKELILFIIIIFLVSGIAAILSLNIAKYFSKIITKVNYKLLIISIIIFISCLSVYFGGLIGIFVLLVSTSVGILPAKLNIPRNHAMGCLMLPVILYFI